MKPCSSESLDPMIWGGVAIHRTTKLAWREIAEQSCQYTTIRSTDETVNQHWDGS